MRTIQYQEKGQHYPGNNVIIHYLRRSEGEGIRDFIQEVRAEDFPNLGKKLERQVHEAKIYLIISTKKDLLQDTLY